MKNKFSRIVMLGLVLVLAIALAVPTAVVAKELEWGKDTADTPFEKTSFASGKAIQPFTDILDISAANDGTTIYAVVRAESLHPSEQNAQEVWRSTNAGETWASRSPTTSNTSRVAFVAVAPDDPSTVVAVGTANLTGTGFINAAWISTDKGETWSASDISSELSGNITSVTISEERDDIRWVAVGSDTAAKCLAVAKAEAFAGWDIAGATSGQWTGWNTANSTGGVLAIAFSPWFNNDDTLLVVTTTSNGLDNTVLQAAVVGDTWATCYFNASTTPFASYPVEIGTDIGGISAASISLPDTYYGLDAAERIAYIGTTDGVYRMDDDLSEKIKSGSLPRVAYNSADNQLLVGYSTSGRVDMSSNPDSGSPTFTRPASMKSPSGESVSEVAWVDSTMMCSTEETTADTNLDDESAISVSTDARAWSQLSLIDTDLSDITDIAVSADGSKVYLGSQSSDGDYYSVWRYASRWERVLCDLKATSQTSVIVRLAPEKPEVVFVALKGTKEIRRSTDSGETWKQSRSDIAITDMVAKDDKIVLTVTSAGYVSVSTDGGRTFADYVKSGLGSSSYGNVHMIVAPNGDILIGGADQTTYEAKAAYSTDDGASWTKSAQDSDISASSDQIVIAADKDYATNNIVYIAQGDEIVRWAFGGDKDKWEDIEVSGCPITADDTVTGLGYGGETLYALYYNTTDNTSGFGNTLNPTSATVYWGGEEISEVNFSLVPQALQASTSSSSKLWTVDTKATINAVWTYTDPIGAVGAPVITAPADAYKASVDAALQRVNPIGFVWEQVHKDCSYELKIAANSAMSQQVLTYNTSATGSALTGESLLITDGTSTNQYPFASGETYYWRIRVLSPVRGPYSETRSFTIAEVEALVAPAPVITVTPPAVTVTPPAVTVEAPAVTVEAPPAAAAAPAIPAYLLWTIIGIGAVLVIALIILIVRTRRVV